MIKRLAELLKTRKGKYILFLGAGASLSSGGKTTREIVKDVIERYELDSENQWEAFCSFLRNIGGNERFSILSRYFNEMEPSFGYEKLAKLIENGYFRLILTTNFDYMLEEALKKTKLVLSKDYFICVVGAEKEDVLVRKLEDESMIRIVKLHGDYKTRILPFTEEETFKFEKKLEKCLKRVTKEGIIFMGYSGMDRDVLSSLSHKGESLWWINPKKVTADRTIAERHPDEYELNDEIYKVMINRDSHENFIWRKNGKSDVFFEKISEEIFRRDINSFCNLFKFGAKRYRKMKDLFEPPYHYDEMKQKLEKHGVLLILGEPHLGKTYTALNLLYDFYVKGFDVVYKDEIYRREWQWEMMYRWEDLLKPNTVVYFEDPFGKTDPENVQIFRSELKRIIVRIQNSESIVIITSRLNIFKEIGDPNEFPMIVELMKKDTSYDLEKRKRIINRYVAVYRPLWQKLLNQAIGKSLIEYIASELTEPHNIELFFERSLKISDIGYLLENIQEAKKILEAFRQEIRGCSTAEKIFFYICNIFNRWRGNIGLAKKSYFKVIESLDLDPYKYDFCNFLRKYDFRVEIYEMFGIEIRFSHPEFSKAISESFRENISITGNILLTLAKDEDFFVRRSIVHTVGDNFEKLPDEYRKLLFDLAKDEDTLVRSSVAYGIEDNFEKLPDEYRKLLFDLAKDENVHIRKLVARIVGNIFKKLPDEYRKLLLELSEDEVADVRASVALAIGKNLKISPLEYQRILKKFKADVYVLDSLRQWIKKYGEDKKTKEIVIKLERELNL